MFCSFAKKEIDGDMKSDHFAMRCPFEKIPGSRDQNVFLEDYIIYLSVDRNPTSIDAMTKDLVIYKYFIVDLNKFLL